MTIARYDQGFIQSSTDYTEEGFLKCEAIVTRTGVFLYRNADGSMRSELRLPEEVFNDSSIDSMKMIPVTNDHPKERLVSPENSKSLSVGYTGENISKTENYVYANFIITDKNAIDEIVNHGKRQLSLGYTVELEPSIGEYEGQDFDFIQRNIRYNHLSIVHNARAGNEAKISLDSQDAIQITKEEKDMTKRMVKIDEDEFMVEPEMAESVEKLLEDLKSLKDAKVMVDEELKMVEEKLQKAMGERDNAKEEATALLAENSELKEEKTDSKEIEKLVRERIKLLKVAESVLNTDDMESISGCNDIQIKKKIIKSNCEKANLDGKCDTYINARFDAVCETLQSKVNTSNVKNDGKSTVKTDSEDSRQKMIYSQMNPNNGETK